MIFENGQRVVTNEFAKVIGVPKGLTGRIAYWKHDIEYKVFLDRPFLGRTHIFIWGGYLDKVEG